METLREPLRPAYCTSAVFNALPTKDAGTLYFLSDTQEIYRGATLLVRSGNTVRISGDQTIGGVKTFSSQIISSVAQGIAPISVASTTVCPNLNASLLQGNAPSAFATASHVHSSIVSDTLTEPNYVKYGVTKTAKSLFDVLRANRLYFLPADQIIIEQSTDAGVTWTDAAVSDTVKRQLFDGERPDVRIPLKNGVKSTDCMIRITITGMKYNVPGGTTEVNKYSYWNSSYYVSTERYCSLNDMWAWVSSNSDSIYCKVEKATGAASTSWVLDREAYMSGWSGGNYVSLSGNNIGGFAGQTTNYWNWRITFRTCTNTNTFVDANLSTSYTTTAQSIYDIKATGPGAWVMPNKMMYQDHIYSWDYNQNVTFPAAVASTGLLTATYGINSTRDVTINGGGSTTFLRFQNSATNIAILGSDAAIYGGTATDVGLYVYGNNRLVLSTNNIKRLSISGAGAVGIGYTSPTEKLEVRRADNSNGTAVVFGSQSYAMGRLGEDADTNNAVWLANSYGNGNIDFRASASGGITSAETKMRVTSAGRIGIGALTPRGLLSVQLASLSGGAAGIGSSWDSTYAVFGDAGNVSGKAVGIGYDITNDNGALVCASPGVAWKSMKYFAASHSWNIGSNAKMTLDGNGALLCGSSATLQSWERICASASSGAVGVSARNGNKTIFLYNDGTDLLLDAYDYGANAALAFSIAQNRGKVTFGGAVQFNGVGAFNHNLTVGGTLKVEGAVTASAFYEA